MTIGLSRRCDHARPVCVNCENKELRAALEIAENVLLSIKNEMERADRKDYDIVLKSRYGLGQMVLEALSEIKKVNHESR